MQKHFATLPFQTRHLHLHYLTLLLCYNIYFGINMSTTLFSLSAAIRVLLALVLVAFIALAVRWAVALP
ncbi:hypothetical protein OUHCRE11_27780 [Enterobacter asburiae]|nr:hypothetical protein ENTKAS01_07500 [Enterobacter sp. AS-1]CZZ82090.1 Uncharacterised protein [Enterobacter cloacae]